ncbi:MAG: hypothetical protein J6B87_00385 [Clostridia bacterium]|nr:hypothetical protein [Clostridia bacterium]
MKLIHWAVIFVIVILPFSLICRNNINNRFMALKDEVRINNSIDTATQDAADLLAEWATLVGGPNGKNLVITEDVANAAINQFFTTMAVNMNLPYSDLDSNVTKNAKVDIESYIPAIIIVGYDGFYIYSAELVGNEIKYILKPKIPYAYEEKNMVINFTLDNYVKIYNKNPGLLSGQTARIYEGYLYDKNSDIYLDDETKYVDYAKNQLIYSTTNLSLILDKFKSDYTFPEFLLADNVSADYKFDEKGNMIKYDDGTYASDFHQKRRETIVNLITQALTEEVNEHNHYSTMLGVQYDFSIPEISKEKWINTVDDITILAFIQGVPIGIDQHYNSYALGGTRIVRAQDIYGGYDGKYHKETCSLIDYENNGLDKVQEILLSKEEAVEKDYFWCEVCQP